VQHGPGRRVRPTPRTGRQKGALRQAPTRQDGMIVRMAAQVRAAILARSTSSRLLLDASREHNCRQKHDEIEGCMTGPMLRFQNCVLRGLVHVRMTCTQIFCKTSATSHWRMETEMNASLVLLATVTGYLLGAISFARIEVRLKTGQKVAAINLTTPDGGGRLVAHTVSASAVRLQLGPRYGSWSACSTS